MNNRKILAPLASLALCSQLAYAAPVRLDATFSNPVIEPGSAECFALGTDPNTGLPFVPPQAVASFFFDDTDIPQDDVLTSYLALPHITGAELTYGDVSWGLTDLTSFALGTTTGGDTLQELTFEFGMINTPSTQTATATSNAFELVLSGQSLTGSIGSCTYTYTAFDFEIVPDEPPIPGDEDGFAQEGVVLIGTHVRELGDLGVLTAAEVGRFESRLGLTYHNLQQARVGFAALKMGQVDDLVSALDDKDRLSDEESDSLRLRIGETRSLLDKLRFNTYLANLPDIPSCQVPAACENPPLYVSNANKDQSPSPDGSPGSPFATIADALAAAHSSNWQCVDVVVSHGQYAEGLLEISRDTRLIGEPDFILAGSVRNVGNHYLGVRNAAFVHSDEPATASLHIESSSACTLVEAVTFSGVEGHAIDQAGGALTLRDVTVVETKPRPGDIDSGNAIRLSGSVDACFSDVNLSLNQGGALLAQGVGTRVFAARLQAFENRVHPDYLHAINNDLPVPDYAAIHARDGALTLGEVVVLSSNELGGIGVSGGAKGHFRNLHVRSTVRPLGATPEFLTVTNTFSRDATSALQMTSFSLSESDVVGAFIGAEGHMAMRDGLIADSEIGVTALDPNVDFECLASEVRFRNCGINLDSVVLPEPSGFAETQCNDGVDNDLDGKIDGADADCSSSATALPDEPSSLPTACPVNIVYAPTWCDSESPPVVQ